MIVDQFGRPIGGGNRFLTPEWLTRETARVKQWDQFYADQRVADLRASILGDEDWRFGVGETVRIKLPERFR
jgi:hypothetical protein